MKLFFSTGTTYEGPVFTSQGKTYGNGVCDRCSGAKIINDPRYMRYTAGGQAGGCFKCNATGIVRMRVYTAKQYAALAHRREKAQAKRVEANRKRAEAWHAERDAREVKEAKRREALAVERAPIIAALTPLADAIADGRGGFCDSIASDMREGSAPRGRGSYLVADILAKQKGRRNSKAYDAEFERVEAILEGVARNDCSK